MSPEPISANPHGGRNYQPLWSGATLPVTSLAEDSPSGLGRTIGNRVGCYNPRGFKSRILRQLPVQTPSIMITGQRCSCPWVSVWVSIGPRRHWMHPQALAVGARGSRIARDAAEFPCLIKACRIQRRRHGWSPSSASLAHRAGPARCARPNGRARAGRPSECESRQETPAVAYPVRPLAPAAT